MDFLLIFSFFAHIFDENSYSPLHLKRARTLKLVANPGTLTGNFCSRHALGGPTNPNTIPRHTSKSLNFLPFFVSAGQ